MRRHGVENNRRTICMDKNVDTSKQENKAHHAPKRKEKNIDVHNIKAFGFDKGRKAKDAVAHQLNIEQIRLFQPPTRKITQEDPPIIVAVQGPPECGKSLLIKCLIKHYSRQRITDLKGPITVVTSKLQRITFIEVANDINSMIDAAKIADIVLLCVNGVRGFEMETFEFLNLLLNHGFPKVIGVLTHLDLCDKSVAKNLKSRFRKELNTNVKIYKLERLINNQYEKKTIQALARLLNVAKVRVINFREGRGYCLVDRAERSNDNPKLTVLFGYSRGIGLKAGDRCHLAGCGDCTIIEARELDDPCPLVSAKASTRTLVAAQRAIHAPMSVLGGLLIDEDGASVDLPRNQINFTDPRELGLDEKEAEELAQEMEETEGVQMVRELTNASANKEEEEELELFPGEKFVAKPEPKSEKPAGRRLDDIPKIAQKEQKTEEEEEEEEEMDERQKNGYRDDSEDDDYDIENTEQKVTEIEEGRIRAGKYVRLEFDEIPDAFLKRFDPTRPLVLGTLMECEQEVSQQWVKLKKHRFYSRQLKSDDPIVVSVGWRRYQTLPVYFNEDRGHRLTFLKYLKDLSTNYCTFYGPASAVNVGATFFQHIKEGLAAFRVSATGVTIDKMNDGRVMKKLRVKGYPKEIHQRTVIVEGMFTSQVEASQYVGAQVQTVSKIRGVIKAAEKNGLVRCSFEDKLRSSDIIFINGWVEVKPTQFFAEINDLVTDDVAMVRTFAEIRADDGVRPQFPEDSVYKSVEREEPEDHALKVPRAIKQNLPYELKRKNRQEEKPRAVIVEGQEAKVLSVFEQTKMLFKRQQEEKAKMKAELDATREKARIAEERERMHKRTKRKQEFFAKNPKRGGK